MNSIEFLIESKVYELSIDSCRGCYYDSLDPLGFTESLKYHTCHFYNRNHYLKEALRQLAVDGKITEDDFIRFYPFE